MWRFSCDPDWHIDDHLERLNEHVRKEALRIFGTRSDMPRQPWISQETWSIVRQIAPLRRQIRSIRKRLYPARTLFVFRCWSFAARSAAGLTPHSAPHSYNSRTIADQNTLLRSFFFIKYGDAIDAANSVAGYLRAEVVIVATIVTLQKAARPSLEADRAADFDSVAPSCAEWRQPHFLPDREISFRRKGDPQLDGQVEKCIPNGVTCGGR